jgi:tetratricopeptide (TPR) repeat protein
VRRPPAPGGEGLLEEALAEARRLGDRDQEANVLIDLGLASLSSGRPGRARDFLVPALARARADGRRFAEKAALDRLGKASMALRDHADALIHFERSLAIASELGDGPHQADLMWRIALMQAELGRRDRALVMAQAAVDRMRRLGRPQAAWYAHHLDLFRHGGSGQPLPSPEMARGATANPAASPGDTRGPGALRMALTAAGSMAKFLGSGFKTAPGETYRERLGRCAACEHHTGLRCRLCGCFTASKARLLHERCPIGRWGA